MHSKKGQGISLETIVVAIIVIVVLIVLILVFTGRINVFGIGIKDCSNTGGQCLESCGTDRQDLAPTNTEPKKIGCTDQKPKCCSRVTSDFTS